MREHSHLKLFMPILMVSGLAMFLGTAQAQTGADVPTAGITESSQSVEDYWTAERMESAAPMPVPMAEVTDSVYETAADELLANATPMVVPGWDPTSSLAQPAIDAYVEVSGSDLNAAQTLSQPQHGSAPTNPQLGPYGPFQRWTHFGNYLAYPRSIIGKLFFSIGGGNFVCSASVIQKNMLITAGHCNSNGSGTFATNRLFCPSYFKGSGSGSPHPARGCWSVVGSKTANPWHNTADPDYDYACLVTKTTGTTVLTNIGTVTGWAGRAINFPQTQPTMSFGYPAASPFPGYHIIHVAGTEWYSHHFRSGGQSSKIMGNDMTGGSSGGPWYLSWNHKNAEYADTDGVSATDPINSGGPHVNGVNSHKRCRTSCQNPPTATNGVFWQEMSSPPFRSTAGDPNETEDIISICAGVGGI